MDEAKSRTDKVHILRRGGEVHLRREKPQGCADSDLRYRSDKENQKARAGTAPRPLHGRGEKQDWQGSPPAKRWRGSPAKRKAAGLRGLRPALQVRLKKTQRRPRERHRGRYMDEAKSRTGKVH